MPCQYHKIENADLGRILSLVDWALFSQIQELYFQHFYLVDLYFQYFYLVDLYFQYFYLVV